MKKKGLIISGIIIALLTVAIVIISNINPVQENPEDIQNTQNTVTGNEHEVMFELETADEILLETADFDIRFINSNGEWGIDGIAGKDLARAKVKAFVFTALSYTSNTVLGGDESEYGLDNPVATITIKAENDEHIVKIGDVSTSGDVCFASVDDKKFTMNITQRDRLLNTREYYTEVSRIMINSDEITAVTIVDAEHTIDIYIPEITRFEGNIWQMRAPYEVMANDTYIDMNVLPSISAITLAKKTDDLGEERATLTVKTEVMDYVFKIGSVANGEVAVEYEGDVYLEPMSTLAFIDAETFEYMHKLVSYVHIDDIKSVTMEYSEVTHTFERNGDKYKADGTESKADASQYFYTYLIGVVANGMYKSEELGDTLLTVTFNCTNNTSVKVEYRRINEYTAAVVKNGTTIFTTGIYDVEDLINKIEIFYM